MGHYTRFTFSGKPKPEHLPIFEKLLETGSWEQVPEVLASPALQAWPKFYRADFIPFGYNCFEGDEGQVTPHINADGCLVFDCSLKNYEGEINAWLSMFSPLFSLAKCVTQYEGDEPNEFVISNA